MYNSNDLYKLYNHERSVNRLRGNVGNGAKDPLYKIGNAMKGNPFFQMQEDEMADKLSDAEKNGVFNDKDVYDGLQLLDMLEGKDDENFMKELESFLQRQLTHRARRKQLIKWYRIASKAVDSIPQFVNQFKIPLQLEPDPGGTLVRQVWKNESPALIMDREKLADDSLFPIVTKHVERRMRSTDILSMETILLDISGSMSGEPTTMALLYLFNRIEHVRKGHLLLQIILFDDNTTRVGIKRKEKIEYIFSNEWMKDDDYEALEDTVYDMVKPYNGTDLMQALRYLDSNETRFLDSAGRPRKGKRVFTIVTDDGSGVDSSYRPNNVTFNALLAGNNNALKSLAIQTGGYHNTLEKLLRMVK